MKNADDDTGRDCRCGGNSLQCHLFKTYLFNTMTDPAPKWSKR